MRPEVTNCLQVEGVSDYLEPNNQGGLISTNKNAGDSTDKPATETADTWESSFTLAESQSTQPLLLQENAGQSGFPPKPVQTKFNNNYNDRRLLTNSISLDAGALVKQPIPYANVKVPSKSLATENTGSESAFTVSRHLINDAEISC